MNTATADAMAAVIAITMTISINVTPRWGDGIVVEIRIENALIVNPRSWQRIRCVAQPVAVKDDGRIARSGYRYRDEQALRSPRGVITDSVERLTADGDGHAISVEPVDQILVNVPDARRRRGIRIEAVVVVNVVERRC